MNGKDAVCSIVSALALYVAPTVARANEPPRDYFLIPVVASHSHDSTGAVWSSTVSFVYTGEGASSVFSQHFLSGRDLLPGEHGVLEINAAEAKFGPGAIFSATGFPTPKELHVQSYVYNEASPGVGVSIPVVRLLADLTANQTIHLLGIPIGASSRTLVRIYAMPTTAPEGKDPDVLVHVFDSGGHPLATDMVQLVSPPLPTSIETNIDQPAYAQYRPSVDPAKYSSISIDIEPIGPRGPVSGLAPPIWAFATTTSASSDSVTAVFPAK